MLSLLIPLAAAHAGYEDQLEEWGLALHARERDPSPEGKVIEEILIASEEVVSASDPFPDLVNVFHRKTREGVIRQELLFHQGQPYQPEAVKESERNLRRMFILAVARVVPAKGREGGVALVVVTKDRWSLRLNSDFNFVGDILQLLQLRPSEYNFLGLNHRVALDFLWKLDTLTIGQIYEVPRLFNGWLTVSERVAAVFNRQTWQAEGGLFELVTGHPLRSLDQQWGFSISGFGQVRPRRVFRGSSVWELPYPSEEAPTSTVPFIYNGSFFSGGGLVTRSFGREKKTNLSLGAAGYSGRYEAPPEAPLDQEQRDWLKANYLPRSESATYLTAQVRAYEARYQVMQGLETFELSEDHQLGYAALAIARWAEPVIPGTERFLELGAIARYTLLLGDDLATLSVGGSGRSVPGGPWVNRRFVLHLLNYFPSIAGGRLVFRGLFEAQAADLDHRKFLLGGGNGLRGAPAEGLDGENRLLFNLEYRTRPLEVRTLFWGLVFFYDAGSAYDLNPQLTHTFGLGLRCLVPQWNQETIRIDFGLVLGDPRPGLGSFSGSFAACA